MSDANQPTNIFAMFQKNPTCHYPTVRIDFTQVKDQSESAAKGENVFKKITPSYNNDRLYFTDAFVLESDNLKKSNPQANSFSNMPDECSRDKFDIKIQKENANMEIEVPSFLIKEIYPAEPQSFFCQICRIPFENYIQHIQDKDHIRNLEFSKGHKFIKEICKHAKKYLTPDQTTQIHSLSESKQKTKPIRQKKGATKNGAKNQKNERKIGQSQNGASNMEIKGQSYQQSEGFKSVQNEEFGSIINGQMKIPTVEKLKIQTQD